MGYLGSFFGIEAAKHQQEEQANNQQRTEFCLSDQVPQKMATLLDANELAATTKMYKVILEISGKECSWTGSIE